jgi:hypothetical protein
VVTLAKFLHEVRAEPQYTFTFTRQEAMLISDVFVELMNERGALCEPDSSRHFRPVEEGAVDGIVSALDNASVYKPSDDWYERWISVTEDCE